MNPTQKKTRNILFVITGIFFLTFDFAVFKKSFGTSSAGWVIAILSLAGGIVSSWVFWAAWNEKIFQKR